MSTITAAVVYAHRLLSFSVQWKVHSSHRTDAYSFIIFRCVYLIKLQRVQIDNSYDIEIATLAVYLLTWSISKIFSRISLCLQHPHISNVARSNHYNTIQQKGLFVTRIPK